MAICEITVQGSGYTRREFKGAAAFALLQALKPCASYCVLQSPHICQGPLAGNKSGPRPVCSHSWNKLTFTSKTQTDYSDIWDQFKCGYWYIPILSDLPKYTSITKHRGGKKDSILSQTNIKYTYNKHNWNKQQQSDYVSCLTVPHLS